MQACASVVCPFPDQESKAFMRLSKGESGFRDATEGGKKEEIAFLEQKSCFGVL
jgi:hypothetical protein